MASPMPDIPEEFWAELTVELHMQVCPFATKPNPGFDQFECGMFRSGGEVDCSMKGISTYCSWVDDRPFSGPIPPSPELGPDDLF